MITITQWAGLATNASPYSIPPGAAVTQVNLQSIIPGSLSLRPGTAAVTFTAHSNDTANRVWSMARYPRGGENIVYQDAGGFIRVARGPA